MEQPALRHDRRYYQKIWFGSTLFVAAIFGVPFAFFFIIFDGSPELKYQIFIRATPSMAIGVFLAIIAGHRAVRFLQRTTERIAKARELAQVRENERDLAQQELINKLKEEHQIAQMKLQLESQLAEYEKYAALAQLALGAAHEINNPLLGILGHLELTLRDAKTDEDRIEIEQCIEGTRRISQTIRGLLNYTRPDPLLLTRVNLDRMVEDAFSFLYHQPLFRGISLEKKIARDFPEITADSNQLSQVLMNLLINAAQASPSGGKITVSARDLSADDTIEITVSDTGSGIPSDVLPHVFEPFFTTKRGKGTGLGLSITKAYVRSHGGDIHIDSRSGPGTSVRITLPIRQKGREVPETEEVIV